MGSNYHIQGNVCIVYLVERECYLIEGNVYMADLINGGLLSYTAECVCRGLCKVKRLSYARKVYVVD